jgi:class 3 adenylate cyclase
LAYFATPVAGAIAAMIEGQSRRQKRVKENDPSALIAEMIHLEWRLRPRSQSVCVLVVDASKSSEMKAMADPFEAEWSFREYQKFLERVAVKNGGLVHSTAGDGAVIGFSTCQDALQAAHGTYAELAEFNQTVNRLQTPFRLRIGIHVGEIQGALDQVEFTEVIDIAAHIEGAAPIGGIAMSKAVLNELPGVLAMPINRVVDGYEVYTVGGPSFAL